MKKMLSAILIGVLSVCLCACGNREDQTDSQTAKPTESGMAETQSEAVLPDLGHIRSICSLATMECYYHNVAKSVKEKGSGISHWGEKDRKFWIEYTGVAKIGINMSDVAILVDGNAVTVTLPKATLISCGIEEIDENSFVYTEDSWNKNPITADEQTAAVDQAQNDMKANIENDAALLETARERAKKLIENYIEQLGEASGTEYVITWKLE